MKKLNFEMLFLDLLLDVHDVLENDKKKDIKHDLKKICQKYKKIYQHGHNGDKDESR